jgi:adenylate cyclase
MMDRAFEIGIPPERVLRLVRNFAQAVARLVDMQREFVDEVLVGPAIAKTGSAIAALEATSEVRYEYRNLGRATVLELMDQGMDEAIFRSVVQLTEQAMARGGVGLDQSQDGVTFIDISDYSRLAEEQGDEEAAVQASRLAGLVQDVARDHGSRMVKSLGDGALVHAPNANAALEVALDAVEKAADRGVWTLHAGVHAGPVVPRDGDLFGSAVNIASRLVDEAGPGQVVASGAVVDACFADGVIQIEPAGTAQLKNIADPVKLFAVTRKAGTGIA